MLQQWPASLSLSRMPRPSGGIGRETGGFNIQYLRLLLQGALLDSLKACRCWYHWVYCVMLGLQDTTEKRSTSIQDGQEPRGSMLAVWV
eukprot:5376550-Amphidinium_carterae.1